MRMWLCPSAFAPHRGGVEELTLKLAQHLLRRGHDVLVVTNRHPPELPGTAVVEGVQVHRVPHSIPSRRPGSVARHHMAAPGLRASLEALPAPELLHLICLSSQMGAMRSFATRHGLPLVLTTQGETAMDATGIYRRNPWLRRELRRSAQAARALTACSNWTRRHAATIATPFERAEVILNGVDPSDWVMAPPPTEPVFCAWGRHVREKGFDLLVEAFGQVHDRLPQARLLLGGDGPERASLPVVDGVDILGPLDRQGVRTMLARSRVVVVPSRVEPFGIVALEALASGRGLVYSSRGGLAEAAGPCGRAVDPTDTAALCSAMLAEVAAPTPATDGAHRAADLSWDRIVTQYEALYDRAGHDPE